MFYGRTMSLFTQNITSDFIQRKNKCHYSIILVLCLVFAAQLYSRFGALLNYYTPILLWIHYLDYIVVCHLVFHVKVSRLSAVFVDYMLHRL